MSKYTLEEQLDRAIQMRELAQKAVDSANELRERAREMGGGLLSFGGSGSQRARGQVRQATDRGLRASADAEQRLERWTTKVRVIERQIAERDRIRLTPKQLAGATHVRTSTGWHEVVRINKTTVSVATGYSWTDRIEFDRILESRTLTTHNTEDRP